MEEVVLLVLAEINQVTSTKEELEVVLRATETTPEFPIDLKTITKCMIKVSLHTVRMKEVIATTEILNTVVPLSMSSTTPLQEVVDAGKEMTATER